MTAIVAIPARLKSTRFPRKVLAEIQGRPMLWHVLQGVSQANSIDGICVLTDSKEVSDIVSHWGYRALMTPEDCPSGTARIATAINQLGADIVVNVQADEPLITGAVVDAVVHSLENHHSEVSTPVYPITDIQELTDSNVVKVVRAVDGRALYFSRSPIPHVRDVEKNEWVKSSDFWGHVGVYGFRRTVLENFKDLPEGKLEHVEKLEQLRMLEAGIDILTVSIDYRPHAVDVPTDLKEVESLMHVDNAS